MAQNITSLTGQGAIRVLGNIPFSEDVYTAGQVETRIGQIEEVVSDAIAEAVSTVWKAGESKTAAQLTTALLVAANEGYVYNLTTDATTDSNWAEGAGKTILAGTDVAVINVGTESEPVYKFNAQAVRDASAVRSISVNGGAAGTPDANGNVNLTVSIENTTYTIGGPAFSATSGTITLTPSTGTAQSVTLGAATSTTAGLMSAEDKENVSGLIVAMRETGGDVARLEGTMSEISGIVSGIDSTVSGLKNFSQITVTDSQGVTVTCGTITPKSNSDSSLRFMPADDHVRLIVDQPHSVGDFTTIVIGTSGFVSDVKINSGISIVDSCGVAKIPLAGSGSDTYGVVKLDPVAYGMAGVPTGGAVYNAISGVNESLSTKVSGGTLHTNLVNRSLANPAGTVSGNTIYALLAALHASDGQTES